VFLKDAAQLLGATSLEAVKFAEEVFHFEKRIAELTPNTEDVLDPIKNVQIVTVADLQRQSFSVRSRRVSYRCSSPFPFRFQCRPHVTFVPWNVRLISDLTVFFCIPMADSLAGNPKSRLSVDSF
jgi:hypothetical protein